MALNANIPLSVRPPQIQSPMEGAQQMLTLKDLMAGAQARSAQRDHYQAQQQALMRQQQARSAFAQALQANGGQMTQEMGPLALAAYGPEQLGNLASINNFGRQKVAGTVERAGGVTGKETLFRDEFGNIIGDPIAAPVTLQDRDIGGSIQPYNPITGKPEGSPIEKTPSPEAILTDKRTRSEGALNRGVTVRGQNLAESRAAAEAMWKREQEAKFGGAKVFDAENKIRDDYLKQSGEFIKVRDAYTRVKASGASPSAAGDLALIFNYMKMLDPGSVVREGEFATAQNSGGVPDQVRSMYNQAINGQRLTDGIRSDFLSRAGKLYTVAMKDHGAIKFQFQRIARDYGLNPDRVTPTFDSSDLDMEPPASSGPADDLSRYYR
ncbi:MAG: hypothetical protein M9951_16880 [Burkholderiaceae bacterium]|nr:hypothetical protein [Burkholderiaceae bacterium]